MAQSQRLLTVLSFTILLAACQPPATGSETESPSEETAETEERELATITVADGAMAALTPDGVQIEPPCSPSQIPAGAWYCDMGDVHYAQLDEGDGTCAICGMRLTQQVAVEPGSGSDVPDHAGHGH